MNPSFPLIILILILIALIIYKANQSQLPESFVADYVPYPLSADDFIHNYVRHDLNGKSSFKASVRSPVLFAPDAKLCRDYAARTCRDVRAYDRYSWCYQGQLDRCLTARKGSLI